MDIDILKETYYEGLAHIIIEDEKFNDLPTANRMSR